MKAFCVDLGVALNRMLIWQEREKNENVEEEREKNKIITKFRKRPS